MDSISLVKKRLPKEKLIFVKVRDKDKTGLLTRELQKTIGNATVVR